MNNNILCPESVSAKKKRVIMKELLQGQEAATKLNVLLQKPFENEGSLSSEELIANVLRSFTQALSIFTSSSEPGSEVVAHRNLLISGENGSPVAGSDTACGDYGESRKRSQKGGRGCYKRRKTAQTWITLSSTIDDNYAWRKYGQKEIRNSKFPRNYFRCNHKYDEGCQAVKQVQRDKGNPNMFQTTYIGIHTCNATPKATNSITDSITWESYLLNSNTDTKASPSLTIKQEFPKEETPSHVSDHNFDHSLWSELKDFEPSTPAIEPLKMKYDNEVNNSQHLDMDFGVEFFHFGTDFRFDESQFS